MIGWLTYARAIVAIPRRSVAPISSASHRSSRGSTLPPLIRRITGRRVSNTGCCVDVQGARPRCDGGTGRSSPLRSAPPHSLAAVATSGAPQPSEQKRRQEELCRLKRGMRSDSRCGVCTGSGYRGALPIDPSPQPYASPILPPSSTTLHISSQSRFGLRSGKIPNTPLPHMWRPHFSHMSEIKLFF